jgi:hypothetical protein
MDETSTVTTQALKDALVGGLLADTGAWTVHLGTSSVTLSPSCGLGAFADPFYPEYAVQIWVPTPIVVNLDFSVSCTGASVSFAAPSQMVQTITNVWVTYTDYQGNVQLLEAFIPAGAPFTFGPGGPPLIVNVGFKDFGN